MSTPHKWAEVIKAWADGAEIQWAFTKESNYDCRTWRDFANASIIPNWSNEELVFRVKPEKKSPSRVARDAWDRSFNIGDVVDRWGYVGKAVINAYKAGEIE